MRSRALPPLTSHFDSHLIDISDEILFQPTDVIWYFYRGMIDGFDTDCHLASIEALVPFSHDYYRLLDNIAFMAPPSGGKLLLPGRLLSQCRISRHYYAGTILTMALRLRFYSMMGILRGFMAGITSPSYFEAHKAHSSNILISAHVE